MELDLFRNFRCVFFLFCLLLLLCLSGNPSGKLEGIPSVRERELGKQWTQQKGDVLSAQIEKELAARLFFPAQNLFFLGRFVKERLLPTFTS